MHDAEGRPVEVTALVGVGQPGAHAEDDGDRVLEGELHHPLLLHLADDRTEVFAVDVLERDEVVAVDLPDVDGLDDVRRISRSNGERGVGIGIRKQRGSNSVASSCTFL